MYSIWCEFASAHLAFIFRHVCPAPDYEEQPSVLKCRSACADPRTELDLTLRDKAINVGIYTYRHAYVIVQSVVSFTRDISTPDAKEVRWEASCCKTLFGNCDKEETLK